MQDCGSCEATEQSVGISWGQNTFCPNIIVFYQDSEENVMIKLVATDIDGTLLDEGTDRLNPELFDIVRDLKEKGII